MALIVYIVDQLEKKSSKSDYNNTVSLYRYIIVRCGLVRYYHYSRPWCERALILWGMCNSNSDDVALTNITKVIFGGILLLMCTISKEHLYRKFILLSQSLGLVKVRHTPKAE